MSSGVNYFTGQMKFKLTPAAEDSPIKIPQQKFKKLNKQETLQETVSENDDSLSSDNESCDNSSCESHSPSKTQNYESKNPNY
jgi:hypothetical protein